MRGFFSKEQVQSPYKSEKGIHSCASCGLYKSVESPRMQAYGDFKKNIMVIGEAPGIDEDETGKPWEGRTGKIIQRKYKQLGVNIFKDCINLYAVNCHPKDKKGNDKAPTEYEISCCRRKVLSEIKKYEPRVIILHGSAALSSVIGYRWKKDFGAVSKWTGWTIPDKQFNTWICPTFSPGFIERRIEKEKELELDILWGNQLEKAFQKAKAPFPNFKNEEDCVNISESPLDLLTRINDEKPDWFAFDIETTGLKPYNTKVHKTVCISFCWEDNRAFAIPMPEKKKELKLLKQTLENPKIGKVAQNMKYEDNWLNILEKIYVYPWIFDTMQASHILDNRPGITGLKFQTYVRFGLMGYDDEIEPYLKSADSNGVNRITELVDDPPSFRELLTYNGIDSLVTYRLAKLQMKEMGLKKWLNL